MKEPTCDDVETAIAKPSSSKQPAQTSFALQPSPSSLFAHQFLAWGNNPPSPPPIAPMLMRRIVFLISLFGPLLIMHHRHGPLISFGFTIFLLLSSSLFPVTVMPHQAFNLARLFLMLNLNFHESWPAVAASALTMFIFRCVFIIWTLRMKITQSRIPQTYARTVGALMVSVSWLLWSRSFIMLRMIVSILAWVTVPMIVVLGIQLLLVMVGCRCSNWMIQNKMAAKLHFSMAALLSITSLLFATLVSPVSRRLALFYVSTSAEFVANRVDLIGSFYNHRTDVSFVGSGYFAAPTRLRSILGFFAVLSTALAILLNPTVTLVYELFRHRTQEQGIASSEMNWWLIALQLTTFLASIMILRALDVVFDSTPLQWKIFVLSAPGAKPVLSVETMGKTFDYFGISRAFQESIPADQKYHRSHISDSSNNNYQVTVECWHDNLNWSFMPATLHVQLTPKDPNAFLELIETSPDFIDKFTDMEVGEKKE
jgi:hypothetical protein